METDKPPYYAELQATAGEETNRGTIRDRHRLEFDEPTWSDRGEDTAPCPVDYFLAGVGGCQLETLRHCLEKSRVDDYRIEMSVEGEHETPVDRTSGIPDPTSNQLAAIRLSIEVTTTAEHETRANRCLDMAEDGGCIVSRSVDDCVDISLTTSVTVQTDR
jgi:uncharacterized OsmC-like protein